MRGKGGWIFYIALFAPLLLLLGVVSVSFKANEVDSVLVVAPKRTALVFNREVRQIHNTKEYWKWLVESEDLDVFVISSGVVREKNGFEFSVNQTFFEDIFGERLKLCIIIKDHPDLLLEVQDQLDRYRALLPTDSRIRNEIQRHVTQYHNLGILWRYMNASEHIDKYEFFFVARTDVLLIDYGSYKNLNCVKPAQDLFSGMPPCVLRELKNTNFSFSQNEKVSMSCISKKDLLTVSKLRHAMSTYPAGTRAAGLTFSDVTYFLDPLAFSEFRKQWYFQYITTSSPGPKGFKAESQFFLNRIARTNVTDIRDVSFGFHHVVIRPDKCEVWCYADCVQKNNDSISSRLSRHISGISKSFQANVSLYYPEDLELYYSK